MILFKDLLTFKKIFVCAGSSMLRTFPLVAESRGFSCCRTWALGVWASVARAQ